MQFPTAKNSLNKQSRQGVQSKRLKNHDRILYINGFALCEFKNTLRFLKSEFIYK